MWSLIFSLVILVYFVYVYSLVLGRDYHKYKEFNEKFAVIIPCYNEEGKFLKKCVDSVFRANGNKEVILVNNNSNKQETLEAIKELKKKYPSLIVVFEKRQGKRFAHSGGMKKTKSEFVVFIDSDTIVTKNSLNELVKPFQRKDIGAVCGNIRLANKNQNIITKSLNAMYWNSFEFYRRATTGIGYINVCSGALCAYRKSDVKKLEKEYLNQQFMGQRCDISDDTFLSIKIQTDFNQKVEFQERAIAYTYSPFTIKGYWKQLLRWRQGFLREAILLWKEKKKNIKLLFMDYQYNLLMQSMLPVMKIMLLIGLIYSFSVWNIASSLISFMLFSVLYLSYCLTHKPKMYKYAIFYSILYEFIFNFVIIEAWLKIRHQGKWVTRGLK